MAKRGLGKGLDALFGDIAAPETVQGDTLRQLKLTEIEPNKDQPRKVFDEEQLQALADSIKEHGLIQPIIVSSLGNGFYQIIAGERRWRAARMAGLKELPAIVRDYGAQETMEVALIENLQREDLNPIEEAEGYKSLMDTFSLTQEQISEKVGKSRSAVANSLRLLTLDPSVCALLQEGALTSGHARAILSLTEKEKQKELADMVISKGLSVRETEQAAKAMNSPSANKTTVEKKADPYLLSLQQELGKRIGTKVKIVPGKNKGKIEIEYYDNEQLEYLIALMNK